MSTTVNENGNVLNFLTNLKARFMRSSKNNIDSKIYNEEKALIAKNAYMHAKYGRSLSQKDLLKKFFTEANELIKEKCIQGTYCCMIEIDNDIKEFMPKIIQHFKVKLGYKLAVIDNNTKIIEKEGETPIKLQPNSTFLILMWNDVDISETVFEEKNN